MDTILGVARPTVGEGATLDGHGVVSVVDLEHTDNLLNAVDDEVAPELVAFLFRPDQRCGGKALEVAAIGPQHNGDRAQVSNLLLPVSVVDPPLQSGAHLAAVCSVALACLGGEDAAVLEGDLVGGRQDRLVEEDVLDAQMQPVAHAGLFGGGISVAVEEDLCANVAYALGQLAAGSEDGIEGLDMGIDGGGERGVGRAVLGRVPEQVVAAQRVELAARVSFSGAARREGRAPTFVDHCGCGLVGALAAGAMASVCGGCSAAGEGSQGLGHVHVQAVVVVRQCGGRCRGLHTAEQAGKQASRQARQARRAMVKLRRQSRTFLLD